jgi:glycosyltransferase involved in cell wall biosynthesis
MGMARLSVVIPTRNRPQYLLDAVKTVLLHVPGAEIIVCDNSDTPYLHDKIQGLSHSGRINYLYRSETLGMAENFEIAIAAATGDYIICIGDDDCVGPGIQEIVDWAQENGVESIISYADRFVTLYYWPGVKSKYYGDRYQARLFIGACSGKSKRVDIRRSLRNSASRFGGNLGDLPRVYHGLVAAPLLRRIKNKFDRVFDGASPDIYSAVLIASEANNCHFVDYPFVIPGGSPSSAAGQGAARTDRGSLERFEHTSRYGDRLVWDPRVPKFYSPYTVWASSMLQALEKVRALRIEPSFPRLFARCYLHCFDQRLRINYAYKSWASTVEAHRLPFLALASGFLHESRDATAWLVEKIAHPRPGRSMESIPNLNSIGEAYESLSRWLSNNRVRLELAESTR